MVTNYPQQLAATVEVTQTKGHEAGLMARMAGRLGQLFCAIRGHDSVLHFEGSRVMMRCTSCGFDTPGWEVSGRPRLRYEGDARRHSMTRPRLVVKKAS
jgi:hypothetical protein